MVKYSGTLHQLIHQGPQRPQNWQRLSQVLATTTINPSTLLDQQGPHGDETPLRIALLRNAPLAILRTLLDLCPESARVEDGGDRLPLHWACSRPPQSLPSGAGAAGASDHGGEVDTGGGGEGGSDTDTLIQLLVEYHPRGLLAREATEGRTPLHFLFLFYPSARNLELIELIGDRIFSPSDMPDVYPPGPLPPRRMLLEMGLADVVVHDDNAEDDSATAGSGASHKKKDKSKGSSAGGASGSGVSLQFPNLFSSKSQVHDHGSPVNKSKNRGGGETAATVASNGEPRTPPRITTTSSKRLLGSELTAGSGSTPVPRGAAVAEAQELWQRRACPSYPHSAVSVPDEYNALPIHYAVNVSSDAAMMAAVGHNGGFSGWDRSENTNRFPGGEIMFMDSEMVEVSAAGGGGGAGPYHSPRGKRPSQQQQHANREVVKYLIRTHPNSLQWTDVHNRTPVQYYLLPQEYYSTLISSSSSSGTSGEGVAAIMSTEEEEEDQNTLDMSTASFVSENLGDEDHGAVVTDTVNVGGEEELECVLPPLSPGGTKNDRVLAAPQDASHSSTATRAVTAGAEETSMQGGNGSQPDKITTRKKNGDGETKPILGFIRRLSKSRDRRQVLPYRPQPIINQLTRQYPGSSHHTLPPTILSAPYPPKTASFLSFLLGTHPEIKDLARHEKHYFAAVPQSCDAVYRRTPLHWASFLLVVGQVHPHLEYILELQESTNGGGCGYLGGTGTGHTTSGDAGATAMTQRRQREYHRDYCLTINSFQSIVNASLPPLTTPSSTSLVTSSQSVTEPSTHPQGREEPTTSSVISAGDALELTPLHVLFHTAYWVNCVVHANINDEDNVVGGRGTCAGPGHEAAAKKNKRGNEGTLSRSVANYWKTSPPPVSIPEEYVKVLLDGSKEQTKRIMKMQRQDGLNGGIGSPPRGPPRGGIAGSHPSNVNSAASPTVPTTTFDDVDGRLPLHYATLAAARAPVLSQLVRSHPMGLIATEDIYQRTPLHFAFSSPVTACHQTLAELTTLLQGGANTRRGGSGAASAHMTMNFLGSSSTTSIDSLDQHSISPVHRDDDNGGDGMFGGSPGGGDVLAGGGVGVDIDIGLAALKMEDVHGNYPLHLACENGATAPVIRELIDGYEDALWFKNEAGDFPLMSLCGVHTAYERSMVQDVATAAAASGSSSVSVVSAKVERAMSGFEERWAVRRKKVMLVLEAFLVGANRSSSMTKRTNGGNGGQFDGVHGDSQEVNIDRATLETFLSSLSSGAGESPLHIALWHELPPSTIMRLIYCCPEGRDAIHKVTADGYYPIDIHQMRRPSVVAKDKAMRSAAGGKTPTTIKPNTDPWGNAVAVAAGGTLTLKEWNEIQEILFINHPNVLPYRRDNDDLLPRLVSRIRDEVRNHVLSIQGGAADEASIQQPPTHACSASMSSDASFTAIFDALDNITMSEDESKSRGGPVGLGSIDETDVEVPKEGNKMARQHSPVPSPEPSSVAVQSWKFFHEFTNPHNPQDHYGQTVDAITEDLPYKCILYLCDLLQSTKASDSQQGVDKPVSAMTCSAVNLETTKALDKSFHLFGQFQFYPSEDTRTVLPTGTVMKNTNEFRPRLLHRSNDGEVVLFRVRCIQCDNDDLEPNLMCLKFMKCKKKYEREVQARMVLDAGNDTATCNILPLYHHYNADGSRKCDRRFLADIMQGRFEEVFDAAVNFASRVEDGSQSRSLLSQYRYAIVTPWAEGGDLKNVLAHEKMSLVQRRECATQVGSAIRILHDKGIVHGDVSMRNVLRMNHGQLGGWVLADLTSSFEATPDGDPPREFLGEIGTYRTGNLPPEMFFRVDDIRAHGSYWEGVSLPIGRKLLGLDPAVCREKHAAFAVRARRKGGDSVQAPYDLVVASKSADLWGLGCLLFAFCSDGRALFPTDVSGDHLIHESSFRTLAEWDSERAAEMVYENIDDPLAQDLLIHLLSPLEERKKISMMDVMRHPFFTEYASPSLSQAAQKIVSFRQKQLERREDGLSNERKLRELEMCLLQRTDAIRRLPFEMQTRLDHSSSALAVAAGLAETPNEKSSVLVSPPLSFVVLPYKLVPNKNGRLTPTSKRGVELAEKVGKQFLLISLAIDQYLLDPLQSAHENVLSTIKGLIQLYADSSKSYVYLVDQYRGVPVVHPNVEMYPKVIAGEDAPNVMLRYLPYIHTSVLHGRGSSGGLSGLVKLIFEGAHPHIPPSWNEASKGLVHRFDRDEMIGEIKALTEAVVCIEESSGHPEAFGNRFHSVRAFFEEIDQEMSFAGLRRLSDGGTEDIWASDESINEIRRKADPERILAAHRQQLIDSRQLSVKDARIQELEEQLKEMGGKENNSVCLNVSKKPVEAALSLVNEPMTASNSEHK